MPAGAEWAMGRLNGLGPHRHAVDAVPGLGHHHLLRQSCLQERLDLTDPFPSHRAGGLDGISDPSSRCQILQRSAKYLVIPRLVTRENPMLVPTGTRLAAGRVVQLLLQRLKSVSLGQSGQARGLHGE